MANIRKNEHTTTIQISTRLRDILEKEGFKNEAYEDVIWRWRGKGKGKPTTVSNKVASKV